MKKTNCLIILFAILNLSCSTQNEKTTVEGFLNAYNKKDSIATINYLHDQFLELFENDTLIASKKEFSNNYSWGKVMNDRMEYKIIKVGENEIEIKSTYYSDRDSLLEISPFKSIRTYFLKSDQIIKIIESKFSGFEEYNKPRREKYSEFFTWLNDNHNIDISDIEFSQSGAKKLKKFLIEYSNRE